MSPEETKNLDNTMDANNVTVNILLIVMGICILLGGFEVLWSVMDLF
jgi:hypothetical protein